MFSAYSMGSHNVYILQINHLVSFGSHSENSATTLRFYKKREKF